MIRNGTVSCTLDATSSKKLQQITFFYLVSSVWGCCPKIPMVLAGCKTDNKNTKKLVFILEVN